MKKLLALVLALVMTLGLATVSSSAAFSDADSIEYEEAEAVIEDAEFTPLEESTWDEAYMRGLGYGLLAVCGIAAGAGVLRLCTGGGFSLTRAHNSFHRDTTPIRNSFHDETDFLARKRVWASRAVQTHFGISKPRLPERKRGKHEKR